MAVMTSRQRLLTTMSIMAACLAFSPSSYSQVTVTDEQTAPLETNGQDLTIDTTGDNAGAVTITTAGPAVTLNSDNILTNNGVITISDIDNATGVSLEGGANRSFVNTDTIRIDEDFTAENTDDDPFIDGGVASGTGRTGILISGASPFEGNIELASTSVIDIEGNDSFGINLTNTAMAQEGLTGNLSNAGQINVLGTNATAINIASDITGDFTNSGLLATEGEGAQGINVDADIQGSFANAATLTNTGFRFSARPGLTDEVLGTTGRDQLGAEDLLQAGSAINISGNISEGIQLQQVLSDALDTDGNQTFDEVGNVVQFVSGLSSVTQNGSAPAVRIDGNGTPISIGLAGAITDPTDENFDADLQFALINEGAISANGVFDDFDSTAVSVSEATLAGGFRNAGTLSANSFIAPTDLESAAIQGTGLARAVVFGNGATSQTINNTGSIQAQSSEAIDAVFADADNPLTARNVASTAIEIESGAVVNSIENSGLISAAVVGRLGNATALIDNSGTLSSLNNSGIINAIGTSSDATGNADTIFTTVALDVSSNTSGFTLNQTENDIITPSITGDVRLGTGNDSVLVSDGGISGNIDFNSGNDTLALSSGTVFLGSISNQDGLDIDVTDGSGLALLNTSPLTVTSANIDATSTFSPLLDGASETDDPILIATNNGGVQRANGLNPGDITFEDGVTIAPVLANISGLTNRTFAVARAENELTIGDIQSLRSDNTPFLYNTNFAIDPSDPNTLIVTLDLRDASTSIENGGLGLDAAQAASFAPAFTALSSNTGLGNAFASITDGTDFNQAFNQLLPEFSAAARQFVLTNVDGATGAVANHLNATRRSQDKPGGAWIQEFAYFADRELAGLSEQYRGSGFGFTGGIDTAVGPFHAVGVNIGLASTEIEDVVGIDEPLDVLTFQGGVYAGWAHKNFSFDAYAGGGYNDFEQNRNILVNSFSGESSAEWSGTHINGSLRAGYDVELGDKFWFRPTVSVDYLRLSENGFEETGDSGFAIGVDERTSEGAGATALFNFGAKFQGKRTWIRPSLRVGARHEFINDPVSTNFRFIGLTGTDGQTFNSADALIQSAAFPDSGLILGFSLAAGSAFSSIGFDFDSDIRDGFIRHTGRVVVRLLF